VWQQTTDESRKKQQTMTPHSYYDTYMINNARIEVRPLVGGEEVCAPGIMEIAVVKKLIGNIPEAKPS